MALKWIDGFEIYEEDMPLLRKYEQAVIVQPTPFAPNSTLAPGRAGYGKSLDFRGLNFITPFLGNQDVWIIGFAFNNNINSPLPYTFLELRDTQTAQVHFKFDPIGHKMSIYSGTTLIGESVKILENRTWYYIELKVYVHPTGGTCELKINELTQFSNIGVKTQESGASQINRIAFVKPDVKKPQGYFLDDLYVLDATGGSNNDFLGDMKIELIKPNATGTTTEWTKGPAVATNWSAVREHDDLYVYSNTEGVKDLYNFEPLANLNGGIAAVAVNVYTRNTDGQLHSVRSAVVSNGVNGAGANDSPINDISECYETFIHETDPNGSVPWTIAAVDAAQFGMTLESVG